MRAMRVSDSTQPPALIEADVPRPQPRRGELLVRVWAAGVTSKERLSREQKDLAGEIIEAEIRSELAVEDWSASCPPGGPVGDELWK
jgi:NADPH:quinone reductase-like Zn-dependent oxidoreductase